MIVISAVLAFLFGGSVGSFINIVADRLPKGQSVLYPPSHCPACGRRLTPLELVPVFSYLALRGRCYQCHSPIPLRVLGVELVLGLLASYVWLRYGSSLASILIFAYAALLVLLAAIDLEEGIIPDVLVYPGIALTLALSPWWMHLGLERQFLGLVDPGHLFLGSLLGGVAAAGFFTLAIVIYRGIMGWGDVKMGIGWGDVEMAGLVGVVSGVPATAVALETSVISGGVAAVVLLLLRRRSRKQSMPFAPFLALGGILAVLWGDPVWRWYAALFVG